MKQDVRLKRLLVLVLLLLPFSVLPMICTGGGVAEAAQITMSIEQWNQFKEQTNLLAAKLNLVDEKLKQQKNTSTELLTQLEEAKKQLSLTQEALTNSKRSLTSAKESLKRSEELYKTLTEQMEYDRKRTNRIKYQRNIYAGTALFFLICAATK